MAADDVSENVTESAYELISEVSPSDGGLTGDVSVVPSLMPGSSCSVSVAKLEVSCSPILEPEVSRSKVTLVEVAEDSHLGVKVAAAADDVSEDLKDSGYDIVPECKTALKEYSIFAVLAVSSLVMKSTAEALFGQNCFYRCFGDHSAEPFVCTVDESNIGDEIK